MPDTLPRMLLISCRAGARVGTFAVMLYAVPLTAQDSATAKTPPVAAGVFTDEQAERGNGVFSRVCVECHTRKDMAGADFRLNWNGRTVFDLFDRIRTTMPESAPGSMTREEYADVTAYFLKLNGLPTGSIPLQSDSTLKNFKLEIQAPVPTPGYSLYWRGAIQRTTAFFSRGF